MANDEVKKPDSEDDFEEMTGAAPAPAEIPKEEKAAIKKDQEERRLADVDLAEEPEALLEQVIARARRRQNLDMPTMITIGEGEDEEEFALTGRSLGQLNMIMEVMIDLGAEYPGAGILGGVDPRDLLQEDEEKVAAAMARVLVNRSGKGDRSPEEMKEAEKAEMKANVRIAQLLVQPKQKMEGKIKWALTEEKARWHLGVDDFWTMYLAFLVRDLEGLAFVSKKAVELGGMGREKQDPQTRRSLSSLLRSLR